MCSYSYCVIVKSVFCCCVCVCVCVHVCICVCSCVCVCPRVCVSPCVSLCVSPCVCACWRGSWVFSNPVHVYYILWKINFNITAQNEIHVVNCILCKHDSYIVFVYPQPRHNTVKFGGANQDFSQNTRRYQKLSSVIINYLITLWQALNKVYLSRTKSLEKCSLCGFHKL